MHRNSMARLSLALVALVVVLLGGLIPATTPAHAAGAQIRLNRYVAGWNDQMIVYGSGFQPNDTVVLSLPYHNGNQLREFRSTADVDLNGNFETTFNVPRDVAQGTVTLNVKDFHGHSADRSFYVLAVAYVKAGAAPSTVYVLADHGFYVEGNGFQAGETVTISAPFPLYSGNTTTVNKTARVDPNGNIPETFVPVAAGAKATTVTLTVHGGTSGKSGKATLKVVYRPYITLVDATILPGTSAHVQGYDYVPFTAVDVAVTIPRTGDTTITLSKTVGTDAHGRFDTYINLPSNTRPGTYRVSAVDQTGGFRATATVDVAVKPTLFDRPNTAYPGESVAVFGGGYSANAGVTVSARFATGNTARTVSVTAHTNNSGAFSTALTIPGNANPGGVTIVARGANGQATVHLTVHQRPPTATPTTAPKATSTAVPATATPPPPTSTPVPVTVHQKSVGFQYISIWYHTVAAGTYNHIVVQSNHHKRLGIWVHVYFPSGYHLDYYELTNTHGKWEKQFNIPTYVKSRYSNTAVVTFRLWDGPKSKKDVKTFKIV